MSDSGWMGLRRGPRAAVVAVAACVTVAVTLASVGRAPALAPVKSPDRTTIINEAMSLSASQLVMLDVNSTPGTRLVIQVPVAGELLTLDLAPHTNRSAKYRVRKQVDDGSFVDVEPQPIRTMRGVIHERPGAVVASSVLDEGLHALILMPDGDRYWIEPILGRVPGAEPGEHVVYHSDDSVCEGVCGVDGMMFQDLAQRGQTSIPIGSDVCKITELAVDADWHYYQARGSSVTNVENRINSIVNALNSQYEQSVGIIHVITEIVIRTSSASNPYSTNNAGTLLGQFRSVWNSSPESNIPRDVAHLFTGRNLGSTLGIAYLGRVCQLNMAYGLSTNLNNFSCASDLTAHELGHNWNASHCSCPSFTMNPSITCANQFSNTSINAITAFRNSRTCLHDCPPPGPANNVCSGTVVLTDGQHAFSNVGATTTGPAEPELCTAFGDSDIQSDVWFGYVASCTGELTISLCGSSYNTKLGVYGFTCPTEPGTILACDTTSCPTSNNSQITIPVVQGEAFRIRVGGYNGAQGDGLITIDCVAVDPPCVGDLNGDGVVDVSDMLALLGVWGACEGCDEDFNSDGVVDVSDLLLLLGAWGQCNG